MAAPGYIPTSKTGAHPEAGESDRFDVLKIRRR
jgi:hypothetical protein